LLYAAFSPQNISDLSVLTAAHKAATEKLALIPGLLAQLDEHLAQERARLAELLESLPRPMRDDLTRGIRKNREAERSFTGRRFDQYRRFMILVSSRAEFLITRYGTFSLNENGELVFQSDADATEYTRQLSELDKLAAEEGALDAEIAAASERRKDALEVMIVGP
jgi:hypothetical protein